MDTHQDRLDALRPYSERARNLRGWIFEFAPTPLGPPPPWDYIRRARELLASAQSVLDLGTGGGEKFGQILQGRCPFSVATEEWPINVPVAAKRLASSNTHVVHASAEHLPFADRSFDLVLSRHEALDPLDTTRVVSAGGTVLTQQVRSDNWRELRQFFPRMTDFDPHFELYQQGFVRGGLYIVRAETHETPVAFKSLGELVYALEATPWTIPDFDLERDLETLLEIESHLGRSDGIVLTETLYILEACRLDDTG